MWYFSCGAMVARLTSNQKAVGLSPIWGMAEITFDSTMASLSSIVLQMQLASNLFQGMFYIPASLVAHTSEEKYQLL